MATNLALDDKLVHRALAEYIDRRKRRRILGLFGKVQWDARYDYKEERRRRG